jgi:ribosomal protein L4
MANYDVLKVDGSKSGSVELSDSVFAIEPNNRLYLDVHVLYLFVSMVYVHHHEQLNDFSLRVYLEHNG